MREDDLGATTAVGFGGMALMPPSSTGTPSLRHTRAALRQVAEVVLQEGDAFLEIPPVERTIGPPAIRAHVLAKLRDAERAGDGEAARELALILARRHVHDHLDISTAVRLAYQALETRNDRELRGELAGWLTGAGRLLEAGVVLLQASESYHDEHRREVLLEAGLLFARGGDLRGAVRSLGEAAVLAQDDPRPLEALAALACFAPDVVSPERAARLWLDAARRYPADSDSALEHTVRSFCVAPTLAEAAESYADSLARQGRAGAADHVLRVHGAAAAGESDAVRQRPGLAWAVGAWPTAIGAALEACIQASPQDEERDMALRDLLERSEVAERLGATLATQNAAAEALLAAARTRSSMGRAKALVTASATLEPELRGVVLAIAAESYAAAGNAQRAATMAIEAAHVAPRLARAQAAAVELAAPALDPEMLEDAAASLPASDALYAFIAERHAEAGELATALCWTRRALELRPGDSRLAAALLERANRTHDGTLIADAALDVLSLPRPIDDLAPAVGATLETLGRCDADLALDLARRIVGAFGTCDGPVWQALHATAIESRDPDFERALLARRAASESLPQEERAALFLRAGELSLASGDAGRATEYAELAAPHAELPRLEQLVDALEPAIEGLSDDDRSDAQLALGTAQAVIEERMGLESAWMAWRKLGGLRWDLAGDSLGAEEAFAAATRSDPARGPYLYARDLCDRVGVAAAFPLLRDRANVDDGVGHLFARALAALARIAARDGERAVAVDAAVEALRHDPGRSEALAVLETEATGTSGVAALDSAYDLLAQTALGRYGYRAAHYRGARQLEQRGAYREALRHALAAFEAVPGEGVTYKLALRLTERCDDRDALVRSLSSVAGTAPPESRGLWLKRAGAVAAQKATVGRETRFDLVLKAFRLRPTSELVDELRQAVRELLDHGDDEVVRMRFERALVSALPRLTGPRGARTALGLCKLAAQTLRDARLAVMSVQRAMDIDLEGTDYEPVLALAPNLASDDAAAVALLEHIRELHGQSRYALPPSLLELGHALERALERAGARTPSSAPPPPSEPPPPPGPPDIAAAVPQDGQAESQARARGDHQAIAELLASRIQTTTDIQQRRLIRLRRAAVLEQRLGQVDEACRELERILEEAGEDPTALRYLADLKHRRGQHRAASALWHRAAHQATSDDDRERDIARACEALLTSGDPEGAQAVLAEVEEHASPTLLRLRAEIAERLDNPFAVGEALAALGRLEAERSSDRPRSRPPSSPASARSDRASPPPPAERLVTADARAEGATSDTARRLPSPTPPIAAPPAPADIHDRPTIPAPRLLPAGQSPLGAPAEQPRYEEPPASEAPRLEASGAPSSRRGARTLAPLESATSVLDAARLGYRLHGVGAPRDAKRLIAQLRSVAGAEFSLEHRDLHTFLLAEALDAVQGGGAALKELETHWKTIGHTPLVALGVAERMVRRKDAAAALHFFDRCVGGRLQGMRLPGAVALKAADVAHGIGRDEAARRYLDLARLERDSRATAEERSEKWFATGPVQRDSETLLVIAEEDLGAGYEGLGDDIAEDSQVFEASVFRRIAEGGEETDSETEAAPETEASSESPHHPDEGEDANTRPSADYLELSGDEVTWLEGDRASAAPVAAPPAPPAAPVPAVTTTAATPESPAPPPSSPAVPPAVALEASHAEDEAQTTPYAEDDDGRGQRAEPSGTEFDLPREEPSDEGLAHAAAEDLGPAVPMDAWAHEEPTAPAPSEPPPEPAAATAGEYDADADQDRPTVMLPEPVMEAPAGELHHDLPAEATLESREYSDEIPPSDDALRLQDPASAPAPLDATPAPLEPTSSVPPPHAAPRARRRLSVPELPEVRGAEEEQLMHALLDGSAEAAETLFLRLQDSGLERSRDSLRACHLWWSSSRGDARALRALRDAAERDGNAPYARCLDHVRLAFDRDAVPIEPPALSELPVQPELTTRLVFSGLTGGVNEALGIVCETGKFRRELADYGLSGADRVPAGAATPVGATYSKLLQLLDVGGARLYHRVRSGPLVGHVALLTPLAAVLEGAADRESPVLRYVVGDALASAMPQCALVLGLDPGQLGLVLGALAAGFGPVGAATETTADQMRLADDFWHLVPAAAGRRLHQIFHGTADMSAEAAQGSARRACRRTGLFAAGDLGTAVGRTLDELELSGEAPLDDPNVLRWLYGIPQIADIIDLATRAEYAEARWRRQR